MYYRGVTRAATPKGFLLLLLFFLPIRCFFFSAQSPQGEIVSFPSGELTLKGVVYRPEGKGPFPAVLYNHGSAAGMVPKEGFDVLGPVFAKRGWVFFGPYRRGQGLSAAAGPYIGDEIAAAKKAGGTTAGAATMVRLLSNDHLDDQLAGLAWLRAQNFVDPNRVAVAGNSFGGIETVLGAERASYCAAIDSAGGAQSWANAPELQTLMVRAVRNSKAPIFFLQAENDYDLSPSRVLSAAMKEAGKEFQMKIYPPFGSSTSDGHTFGYFGSAVWGEDVSVSSMSIAGNEPAAERSGNAVSSGAKTTPAACCFLMSELKLRETKYPTGAWLAAEHEREKTKENALSSGAKALKQLPHRHS